MGLFFTDRLLRVWECMSSHQETVSRGMHGIRTVLEEDADRRARLEVVAEELKLFLGAPRPVPDPALHIDDFTPPSNWASSAVEQSNAEVPIPEVVPPPPSTAEQPPTIEEPSAPPRDEVSVEPTIPAIQTTPVSPAICPSAGAIPGSQADVGLLSPLPPILPRSSSTPRKRTTSPAVEDEEGIAKRQLLG